MPVDDWDDFIRDESFAAQRAMLQARKLVALSPANDTTRTMAAVGANNMLVMMDEILADAQAMGLTPVQRRQIEECRSHWFACLELLRQ